MKTINLIPAPRREAKRRRTHRNVCAAACGSYALLLAAALGVAHVMWSGAGAESVEVRLAAVQKDTDRLTRETATARAELAAARSTIEANRTVAEQPDWSILLGLLARLTGDDVVLRSIAVAPSLAGQNPTTGKAAAPREVVLEVAGVGRTPLSVSRHVLKLEGTGLFAKVVLLDHNREAYLNDNAIAFRVQCTFGDPASAHSLPQWKQVPQTLQPPARPALTSVDPGGATR